MRTLHKFAVMQAVWITLLILNCFLCGCGSEDYAGMESDEYYYPEIQNVLFYGRGGLSLEITPNVDQPSIAWRATGLKYVVVTIFKSKIDLKGDQIANPQDAIWTWNTGLGRGREGNIGFSDGVDMSNGAFLTTTTPLSPETYYIAAWAYDSNYELILSSKEYQYEYTP